MVIPVLKGSPYIAASLSAGLVALLSYSLPFKLGLILAALVGIAVGTFLESKSKLELDNDSRIQANLRDSLDE